MQFIETADRGSHPTAQQNGSHGKEPVFRNLINLKKPHELQEDLQLSFPSHGQGPDGLLQVVDRILQFSVNTWHQGFMDKLYASTNAPGLAAELIIAALNTNVHVYQVAPALIVVEKNTAARLASLFGLNGPCAGGISVQGGTASNTTAIVVARNTLFPETKTGGIGSSQYVLFTSAHGHYSVEKAAQMIGFGSKAVWSVPVDDQGKMIPQALEELIVTAQNQGKKPFFVNATAGTTVYGAFDPLPEIAEICRRHGLWFHVDASWGGSFIFSEHQKSKLTGSHLADSITYNPHKMIGVPLTCSFLLGADLRKFHRANTLPAGYLFHNDEYTNGVGEFPEYWDLGDLTLQCGRRADSLKMFLSWMYYGSEGYGRHVDTACDTAVYLSNLVQESPHLILLTENPPPCLQVCFYYAPLGRMTYRRGQEVNGKPLTEKERGKLNGKITSEVIGELVKQGFMVDYAPPNENDKIVGEGDFFRVVVNPLTTKETIDVLVETIVKLGSAVVKRQRGDVMGIPVSAKLSGAAPEFHPKNPAEMGHGPIIR